VRYVIDDGQLLGLWAIIEYFVVLREITDEEDRSEILTKAQILLTAFIVGLEPLSGQTSSAMPRTNLDQMATFYA
jgi:hypothetical protein